MCFVMLCRVIRLANGLTALLISDLEHHLLSPESDIDAVVIESTSKKDATVYELQKDADVSISHSMTTEDSDSVVATDDGDSSWTDVSSLESNASDDSDDSLCSNDSDDSGEGASSGGFHGGQRHKRARCKPKEYSSEKLVLEIVFSVFPKLVLNISVKMECFADCFSHLKI